MNQAELIELLGSFLRTPEAKPYLDLIFNILNHLTLIEALTDAANSKIKKIEIEIKSVIASSSSKEMKKIKLEQLNKEIELSRLSFTQHIAGLCKIVLPHLNYKNHNPVTTDVLMKTWGFLLHNKLYNQTDFATFEEIPLNECIVTSDGYLFSYVSLKKINERPLRNPYTKKII